MENAEEKVKGEEEQKVQESTQANAAGGVTAAAWKLLALVALAFVVMKYLVPLMSQISEKSVEVLDKEKPVTSDERNSGGTNESGDSEQNSQVAKAGPEVQAKKPTNQHSLARISPGYVAWEPEVREQLEDWIGAGVSYQLVSLLVHESGNVMEVRYRVIEEGGVARKEKLVLKKDGFGERFIYTEGEKEFLVYPPKQ